MRRWFKSAEGLRRAGLVWPLLAAFGLLIALASPAGAEDGSWDPTLPPVVSAGAPGDPVAIANQSLQATANATQTTLDLGRQFLGGLGLNLGGSGSGSTSPSGIPRGDGGEAVEDVIRRG